MDLLIYFVLISAGGITVLLLLHRAVTDRSAIEAKRIKEAGNRKPKHVGSKEVSASIDQQMPTKGEALLKAMGKDPQSLKRKLKGADLNITVIEFMLLHVIVGIAVLIFFLFVVNMQQIFALPLAIVGGLYIPKLWLKKRTEKRIDRFNRIFPDALELMVRSLRTGLPIAECIKSVGNDAPNPVGEEFSRMRDDVKLGLTVSEAVWKTSERMQTQEFNFFAIALSVQSETGGNLAESLENLADILRKRQQIYRMIKAKASEAVWTARLLGALPFVMFGLISMMAPDYAQILYTDTRGKMLSGIGMTWIFFGIIWMRSMIRFDF